jgi:hypothetical protein
MLHYCGQYLQQVEPPDDLQRASADRFSHAVHDKAPMCSLCNLCCPVDEPEAGPAHICALGMQTTHHRQLAGHVPRYEYAMTRL